MNRPQAGNVIEGRDQWQCPCSLFMCGAAVDEKKDGKSSRRQSSGWLNGRRAKYKSQIANMRRASEGMHFRTEDGKGGKHICDVHTRMEFPPKK